MIALPGKKTGNTKALSLAPKPVRVLEVLGTTTATDVDSSTPRSAVRDA
jgi:hypothetical protein